MADIAAGDVTYTVTQMTRVPKQKRNIVKLVFGNGSLTYPSGGIPLTLGKLGLVNSLQSVIVFDTVTFVSWRLDRDDVKLRGWDGDSEISGAVTAETLFAEVVGY